MFKTFAKIEKARLGEMLVRKGLITQAELDQVLGEQQILLGQMLIQSKIISQAELDQTLALQHSHNKKLGEILVEKNIISQKLLERALRKQYWQKNGFWVIS